MFKKAIVCLTLLCLLLFTSLYCQVEQTSATVMNELPDEGNRLVVDSDSTLTIDEGETVECAGELFVQPNGVSAPKVEIINFGFLKFSNFINCSSSNLVIKNYGTLIFQNTILELTGEYGKVEFSNSGNFQIQNSTFDGNYGGTFNINSTSGNLVVTDSHFDVSGSSHGKCSELDVKTNNSTWEECTFNANGAIINYLNNGNLTFQNAHIQLSGWANATIENEDILTLNDVNIQVYTGYMYINNNGTLNSHNLYVKDQNDGTWITNYKDASFSESTFVANGAAGQINIYSSDKLQLHHASFDVNYGGSITLNAAMGNLLVTDSSLDVSGSSHGKYSYLNIIADNATWENCLFNNNAARTNYLNSKELNLYNCTINNVGTGPSTVMSNFGSWVFDKGSISGSGTISISCSKSSELIDCTFNSSGSLTLINREDLVTKNWQVKTTATEANINILNEENGTLTFDKSFIENVSVETLAAIGPEGRQFTEVSGGTITVTNNGEMQLQSNPQPSPEPTPTPTTQTTPSPTQSPQTSPQNSLEPTPTSQTTTESTQTPQSTQNNIEGSSDSNFTSIIAIVTAIIIIIIVVMFVRKKQAKSEQ
jgi:hypothetical protein